MVLIKKKEMNQRREKEADVGWPEQSLSKDSSKKGNLVQTTECGEKKKLQKTQEHTREVCEQKCCMKKKTNYIEDL